MRMKRTESGRKRAFRLAVGTIAWAALGGLTLSSGCASIVGADDYKVGDGGGAGGPSACGVGWTDKEPVCEACMEAQCCSQLQGCAPGTSCYALLNCGARNCGTSLELSCLQQLCAAELTAGQAPLLALAACHNNQCCGGQCSDCN